MTESVQPPQNPPPPASPQPPPPGSHPPGGPVGPGQPQNGMAVAALVLGICAILAAFALPPLGILLGVLAIIFGVIGRNKARDEPAVGRAGMALAGLLTGIAGTVIGLLVIVVIGLLIGGAVSLTGDFMEQMDQLATEQEKAKKERGGGKGKGKDR